MNPEILALCRYASEHNGQLTIVDTFDAIIAPKLPWREYFYVAAKINLADCNADYKNIAMGIIHIGEITKPIFEATSPFVHSENMEKLNMVAGLKGLIFEHTGDYILRISLDETIVAELPFKVMLKENGHDKQ